MSILVGTRCLACGDVRTEVVRCPCCGSAGIGPVELAARGRVLGATYVHAGPASEWPAVLLVENDDGVRLIGFAAAPVAVGMPVAISARDGLPHFTPVS